MPVYLNGRIDESLLVSIGGGTDAYGPYEWLLTPGTKAKHEALLKRNPRLRPSPGYSCYRPYRWQEKYRDIWGVGAAWPGTSSHGGFWEGKQTLAIDYGNWAYSYGNRDGRDTLDKRVAFYADCRAVGLSPGLISKARGYPDEPWHVIDLDPWAPTPAAEDATAFTPDTALSPKEWDEMATEEQIKQAVAEVVADLVKSASAVRVFEVIRGDGSVQAFIGAPGQAAVHITNPTDRDVLERYLQGGVKGGRDRFNSGELHVINRYLPLLDVS